MSEEEEYNGNNIDLGSFEDKLHKVVNEIDQLKNSFSKSTEDLSRIKNMLDIDAFKDVTATIERFEGELSEAERQKEEAFRGAKKYSEELEKEKERLIKLWDAYKKQEEELSQSESKIQEFEKRAVNAETEKQQLETKYLDEINTLKDKIEKTSTELCKIEEYKTKIDDYSQKNQFLEDENQKLKNELQIHTGKIEDLQKQTNRIKELEQFVQYKDKYNEVTTAYEKEKDRLTKLYHLYEETEQEVNRLKKENEQWQGWYISNKDIFNKFFSSAPQRPEETGKKTTHKSDITPTSPHQVPKPLEKQINDQEPNQPENHDQQYEDDKKTKKKGFFRK
jgi:chromosome segregation ATPase